MAGIPSKCPKCGRVKAWKEEINALTSGIPIGGGIIRLRLLSVRGLLARPLMKEMGCYRVTYRCHNCGFRKEYDTQDSW